MLRQRMHRMHKKRYESINFQVQNRKKRQYSERFMGAALLLMLPHSPHSTKDKKYTHTHAKEEEPFPMFYHLSRKNMLGTLFLHSAHKMSK